MVNLFFFGGLEAAFLSAPAHNDTQSLCLFGLAARRNELDFQFLGAGRSVAFTQQQERKAPADPPAEKRPKESPAPVLAVLMGGQGEEEERDQPEQHKNSYQFVIHELIIFIYIAETNFFLRWPRLNSSK